MSERTGMGRDELYPYYYLRDDATADIAVDVPAPVLEHWREVMSAFTKVQDEMEVHFSAASEAQRLAREIAAAEAQVEKAQARLKALRDDA